MFNNNEFQTKSMFDNDVEIIEVEDYLNAQIESYVRNQVKTFITELIAQCDDKEIISPEKYFESIRRNNYGR